jgi:hypothetical protein
MSWILENWEVVLGTLGVFFGGLYVPGVRKLLIVGIRSIISEAVMAEFILQMTEKLVKSSKNKLDDIWLRELKSRL